MIIRSGTICYGSQRGHYNFYYPNFDEKYETRFTLEAQYLPWVSFGKYAAVQIKSSENYLPLKIVWIEKPV
jgi:hypothetical protein